MSIESTNNPHRIANVFRLAETVLGGRIEGGRDKRVSAWLPLQILAMMVVCGLMYGAVMGSFSNSISEIRASQVVYSAIKVPFLLLATFLLSLPSFYVANSLLGLSRDFGQAFRALLAAQSALTLILASLAPFIFFLYISGISYDMALACNSVAFGISSLSVQILLRKLYRPLIARNKLHKLMIIAWIIIYAFVGIQMGWILRPFIGSPRRETTFFREDAWGNAYIEIFDLFYRLVENTLVEGR
jgi:hypothetical protein